MYKNPSGGSRIVPCRQKDGQKYMTKLTGAFRISANASKAHVPSNVKSEFQGAKNACGKCLHSGETTASSLVALWSFLILIYQPDTFELRLLSRLREYLPTVEINSCVVELATLCTLLASQDLQICRKKHYFIGYVCYHVKVFTLWQTFPCFHTNYLTDMNVDIQLYRYMVFGPNPDHINQLKNRKPNENTSHPILEERWRTFTFAFSILHTTLRA